jgi:hypothetical protein
VNDTNRQIVLAQIPQEKLAESHFELRRGDVPSPGEGEVLLRTRYISLDAANRAWMQGATYRSALSAGQVMAGGALAEVVESRAGHLAPGDLVFADTGWQDYAVLRAGRLAKLPSTQPVSHLLSVYGIAGLTAYFGLLKCGGPRAGETVVVSAAGGSVGSLVGQIAKIKGCRTIGIAGGAAKCALLTTELGFDGAVDYKAGDTRRALRAACPDGINVYFDNVGGDVLEACLFNMAEHGRIACCGAVSQYDGTAPAHGAKRRSGPHRHPPSDPDRVRGDGFRRRTRSGAGRPEVVGRKRRPEGARGYFRRPREPAARPRRPSRGRQCGQAHGEGGLKEVAAKRITGA